MRASAAAGPSGPRRRPAAGAGRRSVPTRRARVSGRARSHTTVPPSRSAARWAGSRTAPPPTETTAGTSPASTAREHARLLEPGTPPRRASRRSRCTDDAGDALHLRVGVDVGPAQTRRDEPSHRRLARAHHPDEQEVLSHGRPRRPTTACRGATPGTRPGCAPPRPASRRRTCAAPRTPAPAPSWSRPPRPWPARR